jgi:hypothetical protein
MGARRVNNGKIARNEKTVQVGADHGSIAMLAIYGYQVAVRQVRRTDFADALSYPTRWRFLRRALSLLYHGGQHRTSTRQGVTSARGAGGGKPTTREPTAWLSIKG